MQSSVLQRCLGLYMRYERWVIALLVLLFGVSATILLWRFHRQNTHLVPATGGTYIEGSVGDLQPLNPWFTVTNDVNRDILSLVFSGLLKYNPQTKKIEPDLATYEVSKDGLVYTVTLKKDLQWHDSTIANPHPVTAEDVVFTYQTIQDPAFPNALLRQNFRGVTIEQVDARTAQFRLERPYSFFPSNLTLGLLPKASFEGLPVDRLDQTLDFGFSPIGAGPYKLRSVVQTDLSTEITLERFERPIPPPYHLERLVFRMFSDYPSLLSDIRNLDGIRQAPHNDKGDLVVPRNFTPHTYSLPQYVALFFNLDRGVMKDTNLRLGLQLGTNKQEIVDTIGQSTIVDTPLLELDRGDWHYQFSMDSAQGALFESDWVFPEKIRLQRLLEQREANAVGPLRLQPVVLLDTGAVLTLTGTLSGVSSKYTINNAPLQSNPAMSGSWIVALPTVRTISGALKEGSNLIRFIDPKGKILDSSYVYRTSSPKVFAKAMEEQRLLERFIKSRDGTLPAAQRITVANLAMDGEFLRVRTPQDPVGNRVNTAGKPLTLTLVTSSSPDMYKTVAELVKAQWKKLGVEVNIVIPATRSEFEERVLKRDYDILLFGQSLLDNLDSYPYWHSSNVQHLTDQRSDLRIDAYNLSQYTSFNADALLEDIRTTTDNVDRAASLSKLSEVLKRDVPAVFLYSPVYTFAHRTDIQGVELGTLSLHSDRFLSLDHWYLKQDRVFNEGKSWLSFFGWLSTFFSQDSAKEGVSNGTSTGSGASH